MDAEATDIIAPPIELDLRENPGRVIFLSYSDVARWAETEDAAWGVLSDTRQPNMVNRQIALQRNTPGQLLQATHKRDLEKIHQLLVRYRNGDIVHSESPWGRRILALFPQSPYEAAALLWAQASWARERHSNIGTDWLTDGAVQQHTTLYIAAIAQVSALSAPESVEGSLEVVRHAGRHLSAAVTEWRAFVTDSERERTASRKSLNESLDQSRRALERQQEEVNAAIASFAKRAAALEVEQKSTLESLSAKAHDDVAALITSSKNLVTDLEALFREKIRLEAPVAYWRRKAESHAKGVWIWGFGTALVTLGPLVGILLYSSETYRWFKDVQETLSKGSAGGIAILLVVAVLYLAFGRLVAKLFSTSLSLRNDAAEKVVMAETYLALNKDQKFSDADRALVLAPLFRPHGLPLESDTASGLTDAVSKFFHSR